MAPGTSCPNTAKLKVIQLASPPTRQLDDFELCGNRAGCSWSHAELRLELQLGTSNAHVGFFRVSFGYLVGFILGFMSGFMSAFRVSLGFQLDFR